MVCDGGASAILTVASWFCGAGPHADGLGGGPAATNLPVLRVKNKFSAGATGAAVSLSQPRR